MQSKKAIVIVLVALMITGGMGYFLQTEHHTVEKLTYDYQGDTGPSVQYSQIDEWTEYNPLENVTGWDRATADVPVLSSGSNQYLLVKTSVSYEESSVGVDTYLHLPKNAATSTGPTPLSPIWQSTDFTGKGYGYSSQGIGNNYPENWGEGDFHDEYGIMLSNGNIIQGDEAFKHIFGGYSQSIIDLEYVYHNPLYNIVYEVDNYLTFNLKVDGQSNLSTESNPVYFVPLSTYSYDGLKSNDVVDISKITNFGVVGKRTGEMSHSYWSFVELSYHGTVRGTVTIPVSTTPLPSTTLIYQKDSDLWYPALKTLNGLWIPMEGEEGYKSSDIGWWYVGEPFEGIQSYCKENKPIYYKAVDTPLKYADPTQYVTVKDGFIGEWTNNETNGVITLLASTNTSLRFPESVSIDIPTIPYDYVQITLDFIKGDFYCQGIKYPVNSEGVPIITTVDYVIDPYHYPLIISGNMMPTSATSLSIISKEQGESHKLSVNLLGETWYDTPLTGRNIPPLSVMYDGFINSLRQTDENETWIYYTIDGKTDPIGTLNFNKSTNDAIVTYLEPIPFAGTYTLNFEYPQGEIEYTQGTGADHIALNTTDSEWVAPNSGMIVYAKTLVYNEDIFYLDLTNQNRYSVYSDQSKTNLVGSVGIDPNLGVGKITLSQRSGHEGEYILQIHASTMGVKVRFNLSTEPWESSGEILQPNQMIINSDYYSLMWLDYNYDSDGKGIDEYEIMQGTSNVGTLITYRDEPVAKLKFTGDTNYKGEYTLPISVRTDKVNVPVVANFSLTETIHSVILGVDVAPRTLIFKDLTYTLNHRGNQLYEVMIGHGIYGSIRVSIETKTATLSLIHEPTLTIPVTIDESSLIHISAEGTDDYSGPFRIGGHVYELEAGSWYQGHKIWNIYQSDIAHIGRLSMGDPEADYVRLSLFDESPYPGEYILPLKSHSAEYTSFTIDTTIGEYISYCDSNISSPIQGYVTDRELTKVLGYTSEMMLTGGEGCKVFVKNTVVAVDPLGILWGDPDMYLGYYFEEQMTHDTRLLFNAFVKTGVTMILNGQTFNISKDGYIEVPLGKDGDMIEQHMNGMALDFIDNHVYLVFTQDKDKTLDLGTLDNRPIMVPGTSKVMQQGFLVAATGNWYWESGLYNVTSVEAEEYGFLINGSFGLDMSSAALLMIGIIIICTAAMMYINREDEFSFVDWIIIALAIIILLVLAIMG